MKHGFKKSSGVQWITSLRDVSCAHARFVGNKAEKLAIMIQSGLPVPDGFCLNIAAFRQFIQQTSGIETLSAKLDAIDPKDCETILAIATEIRFCLEKTPIPEEIKSELIAAWNRRANTHGYAIRSSATAEDLSEASFAGQYDSFLNIIDDDALLVAVRRCWISLYSDRAVLYRIRNRIPHQAVSMAVIVQEMVYAEVSGVVFTRSPVSDDPERIVIEASFGLGEALVSGQVSPDRILLQKSTLEVIERQINRKEIEAVQNPSGGVCYRKISENKQNECCLQQGFVRELAKLALEAENLFHGPQDVEWAISKGKVYLLQSRPITTKWNQKATDYTIWCNLAIGEVMPDVVTPMSWSVLETLAFKPFVDPLLRRLGLNVKGELLVSVIAGRVYLNSSLLMEILRSFPFMSKVKLNEALGGSQEKPADSNSAEIPTNKRRLQFVQITRFIGFIVSFLIHARDRKGEALLSELRQKLDQLDNSDAGQMSDDQLASHIPALFQRSCLITGNQSMASSILGAVGLGFGSVMVLFRLSRRWLNDEDGSVANRLISGAGGMDSAEAGYALWRLTSWIRQHPSVEAAILASDTFDKFKNTVESRSEGQQFLALWRDFMVQHGHHTRGEIDVYNLRWREMPDYIFGMVKTFLQTNENADPMKRQEELQRQRQEVMAECQRRLRNPLKRWAFNYLLRKAQRGLAVRENCKSEFVRMISIIRKSILEAGLRLEKRGILCEQGDLFFLDCAELHSILAGNIPVGITATIASRKAEYQRNLKLNPPSTIVGRFDPDTQIAEARVEQAGTLKGLAVSPGVVTGIARIILRADMHERLQPGEILVAPLTDPGWTPYFLTAAAIVMDRGGQLTHGSIVAREYGIPAVANTGSATKLIRTGQRIQVDGNRGIVTILKE